MHASADDSYSTAQDANWTAQARSPQRFAAGREARAAAKSLGILRAFP